jgi:hypothetical protein
MLTLVHTNANQRRRGRPKLGDVRIEVVVPKAVMTLMLQREAQTNVYRTRIAANVLCNWASKETGQHITAYNDRL